MEARQPPFYAMSSPQQVLFPFKHKKKIYNKKTILCYIVTYLAFIQLSSFVQLSSDPIKVTENGTIKAKKKKECWEADENGRPGTNNTWSTFIRESCLKNAQSDKIVVSFSIRDEHIGCIDKRVLEQRQYAINNGADYIFVDGMDHVAFRPDNMPYIPNARYLKFWLIRYFLSRYKQVLFLDETQRMTKCAPNLFTFPAHDSNIVAAADPYDRTGSMKDTCKHYGAHYGTQYCGERKIKKMYNSGLMLFNQQNHMKMFSHDPPKHILKSIGTKAVFQDQAYFNFLFIRYNITVQDLNTKQRKIVMQGFETCQMTRKGKKPKAPIIHLTRVCREELCSNFTGECV